MKKRWGSVALLFLLVGVPTSDPRAERKDSPLRIDDEAARRSMVLVRVSSAYYDETRPWVREAGRTFMVAGAVLPGRRILMLGNDVREAALIEVRKFSSYTQYVGRITRLDMESNLALLTVDDPEFFSDLRPLPMGPAPRVGEDVTALKIDSVFRVSREQATILDEGAVAHFGFTHIPVLEFRTKEPFRAGGVLLRSGRLAGFIGYAESGSRIEAVPSSVMEEFRHRSEASAYPGFVAHGVEYAPLNDPVLAEYHGLKSGLVGPIVTRVLPRTSAFGVLKQNDVILSVDGVRVDQQGFYQDDRLGRRSLDMLFCVNPGGRPRRPGESLNLRVFRDGKALDLKMALRSYAGGAERIRWLSHGRPDYHLESGLLFLELSVPYLRARFGGNWPSRATEFAYLFQTRRYYEEPDLDDRIVILSRVLPDPANRGYREVGDEPVESLNGKKVRNLADLRARIEAAAGRGDAMVSIGLPDGRVFYLDLKNRNEINARIRKRYGVPTPEPRPENTRPTEERKSERKSENDSKNPDEERRIWPVNVPF